MTTYFKNKNDYLKFRAAWSNAMNDPRRKKTKEKRMLETWSTGLQEVGYTIPGFLTASHHVLYNILRNRPLHNGFTPITSKIKLENGAWINWGFKMAVDELGYQIAIAKETVRESITPIEERLTIYQQRRFKEFLEPFDGTITPEILANIELPKIELIDQYSNLGQTITRKIISGDVKINNYVELEELITQLSTEEAA